MITARGLWETFQKTRHAQSKGDFESEFGRALEIIEKALLATTPFRHMSGTMMIVEDIPIKEIWAYPPNDLNRLRELVTFLESLGYQAALHTAEGWPIEGNEKPVSLEVTTFALRRKRKKHSTAKRKAVPACMD